MNGRRDWTGRCVDLWMWMWKVKKYQSERGDDKTTYVCA